MKSEFIRYKELEYLKLIVNFKYLGNLENLNWKLVMKKLCLII